jgi:hypothetical protein
VQDSKRVSRLLLQLMNHPMRLGFVASALATVLLSGCAAFPWPHTVQKLPTIAGTVTDGGLPVKGARVCVSEGRLCSCADPAHVAFTNRSGFFKVRG